MPVTYYSATGAVSFDPVSPRDQAVGPLEVADTPSPPDEIIEPSHKTPAGHGRAPFFIAVAVTALTVAGILMTATHSV